MIIVYGRHPENENDKVFRWKLSKDYIKKYGIMPKIGDILIANTRVGRAPITVVKMEHIPSTEMKQFLKDGKNPRHKIFCPFSEFENAMKEEKRKKNMKENNEWSKA